MSSFHDWCRLVSARLICSMCGSWVLTLGDCLVLVMWHVPFAIVLRINTSLVMFDSLFSNILIFKYSKKFFICSSSHLTDSDQYTVCIESFVFCNKLELLLAFYNSLASLV